MRDKSFIPFVPLSALVIITLPVLIGTAFPYRWHLPPPTGTYRVGMWEHVLVDSSRTEPLSPSGTDKRELLLFIWYPATPEANAKPLGYLDKTPGAIEQLGSMLSVPSWLFNSARRVVTHSYVHAPVATDRPMFPVVLFSHGIGLGTLGQNMTQCEELASHGFIVVSIGHTYEAALTPFPDGRVIPVNKEFWQRLFKTELSVLEPLHRMNKATAPEQDSLARVYIAKTPMLDSAHDRWTMDTRFVVDRLFQMRQTTDSTSPLSHMNLEQLGIFGHSMGGMTAQKTTLEDPRIRAGISYDAPPIREALSDSMSVPFLYMNCEEFRASSEPAFLRSIPGTGYATIRGTKHINFNDFGLWVNTPLWKLLGFTGTTDGYRVLLILNDLTVAFFKKNLRGESAIDLAAIAAPYREVRYREKR